MFPHQILFGANVRFQSGLPFTRTFTAQACSATVTTNCLTPLPGDNNTTILAEPRGSRELPDLFTLDVRAGRFFRFGTNRLELSMDVYNLTNANTVYRRAHWLGPHEHPGQRRPHRADHADSDVPVSHGRPRSSDHSLQRDLSVRRVLIESVPNER